MADVTSTATREIVVYPHVKMEVITIPSVDTADTVTTRLANPRFAVGFVGSEADTIAINCISCAVNATTKTITMTINGLVGNGKAGLIFVVESGKPINTPFRLPLDGINAEIAFNDSADGVTGVSFSSLLTTPNIGIVQNIGGDGSATTPTLSFGGATGRTVSVANIASGGSFLGYFYLGFGISGTSRGA